jgi:ABC-type multidrug transport system ATPase subunit
MVALEARETSLLVPSMLSLPPSPQREKRKHKQANEIIGYLGLSRYADALLGELSTGTRRIVELGALLALDSELLLLDEPTAGVAQKETEAFGPLIESIRKELGASILVIEHDMPMVMSISDRIYCLEAGCVIAEGDPTSIRNNPAVIASYLGTDERAIARSDSWLGRHKRTWCPAIRGDPRELSVLGVEVRWTPMHRGMFIPHHKVAFMPAMAIVERGIVEQFEQHLQH